ncbi:MAG: SagB/ThcOx family dehydrogenase [Deltaproteobacteria bacterium]|nr:SagB/ThcOx family dehydrogenase [Deltaproteobacteria bacterium]TLN03853.1 MAG: SagB/ThcOx family dehydrogenase [bacterium]
MTKLETVLAYHLQTKHRFERYARGPGKMDWATQPNLFRRYHGAKLLQLEITEPGNEPNYSAVFGAESNIPSASLHFRSISQLFFDSMALSAWKSVGEVSWPLRVNPSSGNLHPTECYLLCGAVPELSTQPLVSHYAAKEHGLEIRAEIPGKIWEELTAGLPLGTVLLGFSSIHWRESWKYGERAYRYCQLDVGHALAAVALAAAALGWETQLLDCTGSEQVGQLLGIARQKGADAEEPDCLLAIFPRGSTKSQLTLNPGIVPAFESLDWQGTPNRLSSSFREWKIIDEVAEASRKPDQRQVYQPLPPTLPDVSHASFTGSFRKLVRQRRSAVAMDGVSSMSPASFFALLERTVSRVKIPPFSLLPWPSCVDLVLFVHEVDGLHPGLYLLLRNREHLHEMRELLDVEFLWEKPAGCPAGLDLYLLSAGDARNTAMEISCGQDIAAEGCFSLGMLARFSGNLEDIGPWFYPRLFWECGMIGQVLYLEAEALELRGTGIGCFFDDPLHELLGITGILYQDLYHFTVGGPVEDRRLATMSAYPEKKITNDYS